MEIKETGKVQGNNPIKPAVEQAILKQLDKADKEDAGAAPMAQVEREPTETIKVSSFKHYEKVAASMCRLKLKKKLRKFKK